MEIQGSVSQSLFASLRLATLTLHRVLSGLAFVNAKSFSRSGWGLFVHPATCQA